MHAIPRTLLAASTTLVGLVPAAGGVDASGICGGTVFLDLDADGRRTEQLEHDDAVDDVEPGVGGVRVDVVDADGVLHTTTTSGSGRWSVRIAAGDFPIRIEFAPPSGHSPGRPGPDAGHTVQFATAPDECDGSPTGNVGVFPTDAYCDADPRIAVACYVTADHPAYDTATAIRSVSDASIDDGDTRAELIDDWLRPRAATVATHGEVGAVYGLAARRDGTIYAGGFVKRHTRLTTDVNPSGNPTVIYRIPPGGTPEVLTVVDRLATDPHGGPDDAAAMDDVFTAGLGDLELGPDESTLYTIDLGRRALVEVAAGDGRVLRRTPLDRRRLGRADCGVSSERPFGDLRGFGLGWDGDTLLVGIVCTAASTVDPTRPVNETGRPGPGAGDHGRLRAYVYGYAGRRLTELAAWPLDADRGDTQDNGLRSNDAAWHPWVDAYPFDAEHDVVSYPQPVVGDLTIDARGHLVVALADRWSHQTAPTSRAPAWDGGTRRIEETVAAGDLQRACRRGAGWVIEGSPGCDGGFGDGWEFFDGDRYGWHAETALGSALRLPGRREVVVTQMNPVPGDETWRSGGLAWHDTADGSFRHGVRLYDGRHADPEHTFEQASGVGDLAVLCGGPTRSVGGAIWHDVDADGVRGPTDPPVAGVTLELVDEAGRVIASDMTDVRGRYAFDEDNVAKGLLDGVDYRIRFADRNYDPSDGVLAGRGSHTGLVATHTDVGDRDDLDSDANDVGGRPVLTHVFGDGRDGRPGPIDHTRDLGLRDRYDLALDSTPGPRMTQEGVVAFRIRVRNEGSRDSGAFEVRATLPPETSMRTSGVPSAVQTSIVDDEVVWSFTADQQLVPGGERTIDMVLQVNDPTVGTITHRARISADSGPDEDSSPDVPAGEDDDATVSVELFGVSGAVWIDVADDDRRERRSAVGVVVHVLDAGGDRVGGTTTDADGRFLFDAFPAGSYRIAIPASEFEEGRPLHGAERLVAGGRGDVDRQLGDVGAVVSDVIRLGGDGSAPGDVEIVEVGVARRVARPVVDVLVMAVMLPAVLLCVGWLLLDRRRRLGPVFAGRA